VSCAGFSLKEGHPNMLKASYHHFIILTP